MKKQTAYILGMALSFSMIAGAAIFVSDTPVWAASTPEQLAKDLADSHVPSGSTYLRTRMDDGFYEILYSGSDETFEYKVNSAGSTIVAFESERTNHRGGSSVTVTEADAKGKVTAEISKAEILSVELDREDDIEYEIRFKTDSYYGEYTIHPENGTILQREIKVGTWVDHSTASTGSSGSQNNQTIGRDKAAELAVKQIGGGTVTDVDLDWENGVYTYIVELYKDGNEYEVWINAATGAVLNGQASTDIGAEKAKQISLKEVPGANVTKCERDYDNGKLVYELELYKGGWEYEIDVDGATGTILKMEKEYDD